ncbi:heparinase II/III family protein [Pseudoduganella sp. GCM10020061]|uniref:heparinase II/III domain-containing protein n=1 Tax=Pseudoduganella sp. GCM10020061 TaxID=3317345 RepID=UPI003642904A
MTTLAWKVNRIRLMGAGEIIWRASQVLRKQASRFGIGVAAQVPAPDLSRFGAAVIPPGVPDIDRASLVQAAESLLAGRWSVFALRDIELGFPPQWNRDPKTGTLAPMTPGKGIQYRSEQVVGDIKYLWEPSRHLELVTLALAYRATGEPRYARGARTLLESWLDQCPYPLGVHWSSSLELAVRLLNWSFAWDLLGGRNSVLFEGEDGQRFLRRWLDSVYRHCHFIEGYFSRHSSANNHLFGEYMGLFAASHTWPCWRASARWLELSRRGLEEEALRQNHADGVNKEQAIYYHHEVMDMMLLCQLVARANGATFPPAFLERLEQMAGFVQAMMAFGGRVPMTGDADDAQMVRLAYAPGWCPYRSLLASCALLFGRGDFRRKAGELDDKTRWLFGEAGARAWDELRPEPERTEMAFPQGGYYLLGHRFGTPQEIRMVVDCAPLGYLSIAAHGHADALAFTLAVGGTEVLVDPGTYAYHTQKKWRDYFRSTSAHNTVAVDGCDQSEMAGPFMWMRKANAHLLEHRPGAAIQVFDGEHDGYRRLADPVMHRRRIEFDQVALTITVTDFLSCIAAHDVLLHWHIGEDCTASLTDGGFSVSGPGVTTTFRSRADGFAFDLVSASETPPCGWISRSFDSKSPITTARMRGRINGSTQIVTTISVRADGAEPLN